MVRTRTEIAAEANQLAEQFFQWQARERFEELVQIIDHLIYEFGEATGDTRPHRRRTFEKWREAWVLREFFNSLEVTEAKLHRDVAGAADASIRAHDQVRIIEITEAISSSYFDKGSIDAGDGGPDNWKRNCEMAVKLLWAGARKKARKPYAGTAVLITYVGNSAVYDTAPIDAIVGRFRRTFSPHFQDLHVLWDGPRGIG